MCIQQFIFTHQTKGKGPQKLARERGALCPAVRRERLWMMMKPIYLEPIRTEPSMM